MTEAQELQILEMRRRGAGYKSIATVVGLSRDIVRNFCKARNLTGYASALTKNVKLQIERGEACPYCAGKLERAATGRPKRFCSEKCRRAWWKAHPEAVKRDTASLVECECKHCGKKFVSYVKSNRKYCSHDCYIKERFWEEDEDGI